MSLTAQQIQLNKELTNSKNGHKNLFLKMYTEIKKNTETELRYGMCKKVKYICNLSV
jgi:hypothetical protein